MPTSKQTRRDPVTGDMLTNGEYASWMVQGVIRRWSFLGVITALTAYVWIVADPIWRHPLTDQWNLWASWLAIAIEGITAMALINQTRRDAVIIREIRETSQRSEHISQHIEQVAETSISNEQDIRALLNRIDQQDQNLLKQTNYLIDIISHLKRGTNE